MVCGGCTFSFNTISLTVKLARFLLHMSNSESEFEIES